MPAIHVIKAVTFGVIGCISLTLPTALAQTTSSESTSPTTTKVAPATSAIYSQMAIHHPVWAANGMVASQEALATKIGVDIMQQVVVSCWCT